MSFAVIIDLQIQFHLIFWEIDVQDYQTPFHFLVSRTVFRDRWADITSIQHFCGFPLITTSCVSLPRFVCHLYPWLPCVSSLPLYLLTPAHPSSRSAAVPGPGPACHDAGLCRRGAATDGGTDGPQRPYPSAPSSGGRGWSGPAQVTGLNGGE